MPSPGDSALAEQSAIDRSFAGPRTTHVDQFLVEYVRTNPGVRFGAVVRAAWTAHRFPRTTTARHLSRLVRFGEVTLRPDRTYVAGVTTGATLRTTFELRWYSRTVLVRPDGSTQELLEGEFRVAAGQIDHLEFDWARPPRPLDWWCTAPASVTTIPAARSASRQVTSDIRFTRPLQARDGSWQRYQLYAGSPERYRMVGRSRGGADPPAPPRTECDWIDLPHQTRRFGYRLAPEAHLRLLIALPEGYPVGAVRSRVRFVSDLHRPDPEEEARLAASGAGSDPREGLCRTGTTLALSVPRPRLDRRYEIEWDLPSPERRDRWWASRKRRTA